MCDSSRPKTGWHKDSTMKTLKKLETKTAKETNENRKWNWKRNRNKTESDPINKNEPWTDKLKMNWLTAQTNWIISKWASPKKVTAGWARRDVICRALCCLFLIFEQRSYCPASISRTSWPPTPAKTNSGTLTCYKYFIHHTLYYYIIVNYLSIPSKWVFGGAQRQQS
jgi:hypothetical protein